MVKSTCYQFNAKAKAFELSNFTSDFFPRCDFNPSQGRRLEEYDEFERQVDAIFKEVRVRENRSTRGVCPCFGLSENLFPVSSPQVPINALMDLLAAIHDADEALVRAWKPIESGLKVFYKVQDVFVCDHCSCMFLWKKMPDPPSTPTHPTPDLPLPPPPTLFSCSQSPCLNRRLMSLMI